MLVAAVRALNAPPPEESRRASIFAVAAVDAPATEVPLILDTIEVALLLVTSPVMVTLVTGAAGVWNTAFDPLYVRT